MMMELHQNEHVKYWKSMKIGPKNFNDSEWWMGFCCQMLSDV